MTTKQTPEELLNMKLPIIHIIGLPGAGKTTLAKALSKKLKIPVYSIGFYRGRFPMTAIGEADAWLALFRDLSKQGWRNCILETTGVNAREGFLSDALPFDRMIIVKLEASRKVLMQRIGQKKKSERGGKWLYSNHFKDKYDFVNKLYPAFKKIVARFAVKTDRMTKKEVFDTVLKRIDMESYFED
jgi:adenylate kinase family enzyme